MGTKLSKRQKPTGTSIGFKAAVRTLKGNKNNAVTSPPHLLKNVSGSPQKGECEKRPEKNENPSNASHSPRGSMTGIGACSNRIKMDLLSMASATSMQEIDSFATPVSTDDFSASTDMGIGDSNDDEKGIELADWLEEEEVTLEVEDQKGSNELLTQEEPEEILTDYIRKNLPLYKIMKQVQVFANISQAQQEQVLNALKPASYSQNECIVKQGERGDRFYMITKGTAEVSKLVEQDGMMEERMITHLHPGHYFGELALIYDDPRTATVRAATDVEVMYLTQADFQKVKQIYLSLMLKQVPLFTQLTSRDQDAILMRLVPVTYQDGEYIFKQGEEGDRFYIITRGEAKITEANSWGGSERELTRIYEGDVFGEMSLIYNEPRSASVIAVGSVKCLYLTKDDFQTCLEGDHFNDMIRQQYIEKATTRALRERQRKQKSLTSRAPRLLHSVLSEEDMKVFTTMPRKTTETNTLKIERLANGVKVVNTYVIKGDLGRGAYGRVKLCRDERDEQLYAVKIINKSFTQRLVNREDQLQDVLRREIAIMKKLDHPNIVRLREVIDDPSSQKIYLIQDYIEKGSLQGIIDQKVLVDLNGKRNLLSEDTVRHYLHDILRGLSYLHFHQIIHRDIKPENLLVDGNDTIKIADFGAARVFLENTDKFTSAQGTPLFMPPEVFQEDISNIKGPPIDIWSLGVTLYVMTMGVPPWNADNEISLVQKIQNDELIFPEDVPVKPHLRNLLQRMMTKDPMRRITLEEIIHHEWTTKEGNVPLEFKTYQKGDSLSVSAHESEEAIQNIPEQIDACLHVNLAQAHTLLVQRHAEREGKRGPEGMAQSIANTLNALRKKRTSPRRTISYDHFDSIDMEEYDTISNWRHHKRAALVEGHKQLSARTMDLLLEQKRVAFSAERADVSEILLPSYSLRESKRRSFSSPLRNEVMTQDDESSRTKSLTRKKDFLMVTSEVLSGGVGQTQKRKVLFQARGEDFSIASKFTNQSKMIKSFSTANVTDHHHHHHPTSSLLELRRATFISTTTSTMDGHEANCVGADDDPFDDLAGEQICESLSEDRSGSDYSETSECNDIETTFEDLIHVPVDLLDQEDDEDLLPVESDFLSSMNVSASASRQNLDLGIRVGYAEAKGKRPYMEDRILHECLNENDENRPVSVFAVFDGHGGQRTATELKDKLHKKILSQYFSCGDMEKAIYRGCEDIEKEILKHDHDYIQEMMQEKVDERGAPTPINTSGSTAALAFVTRKEGTERQVELHLAHVGDSRIILSSGGIAKDLTVDHKAFRPDEKMRIENAGGFVHNGRLNGVIALSRSFGDVIHKDEGHLIALPDITRHVVQDSDEFLVLGTDGLFDVLESQEVVNFIRRNLLKHGDVLLVAHELVAKSLACHTQDNVSVVIVCLNQKSERRASS